MPPATDDAPTAIDRPKAPTAETELLRQRRERRWERSVGRKSNEGVLLSAASDFDFMTGIWNVRHRRLKSRLCGCSDWVTFLGTSETRLILGGAGNVEDNRLDLPEGAYCAAAVRSFNEELGEWAIWWLDGRRPWQLDVPVTGRFHDRVGMFYAEDLLDDRPIRVRFTWDATNPALPEWEQAFSADHGQSWVTNWQMTFTRQSN